MFKRLSVLTAVLAACAACSTPTKIGDKAASANTDLVKRFQTNFCTETGCAETRLACALPMGGAVRVLTTEQLVSVQGFVMETAGTCQR